MSNSAILSTSDAPSFRHSGVFPKTFHRNIILHLLLHGGKFIFHNPSLRAIPFKKLLGGMSALNFLDHPAAISENNSDHPAAISAKQVGPPPTLQFHPFECTLQ